MGKSGAELLVVCVKTDDRDFGEARIVKSTHRDHGMYLNIEGARDCATVHSTLHNLANLF